MKAIILFVAALILSANGIPVQADLPGPPPGAPPGPTLFLPGEDVSDASGAPSTPGPLTPIGDTVKPNVPNVVFYDFGTITNARTEPIRHDFTLRNNSSAPVIIDHLQPGCGCVSATLDNPGSGARIDPGVIFTVHVSIDSSQLYVGKINKIVWIYFAGQKSPAFTLHVIGQETSMASFNPNVLDLGSVRVSRAPSEQVTVTADASVYGPHPPDPFSVGGSLTIVRSALPQKIDGTQLSRTYTITISRRAHLGVLSDMIAMPLPNDEKGQGPSLLVTGTVVGDISVVPSSVEFGTVATGKTATRNVTVTALSPALLKGITVSCTDPSIHAKFVHVSGSSAVLKIAFTAKSAGALQSKISVITANGEHLDLSVFGWVD